MNQEFRDLFNSIVDIIKKAEKVDSFVVMEERTGFWLTHDEMETEFRILSPTCKELVISRVILQNRRSGTMTAIWSKIKSYALDHRIAVRVQSVLTKEMADWCLKHRFTPTACCVDGDGFLFGDYVWRPITETDGIKVGMQTLSAF